MPRAVLPTGIELEYVTIGDPGHPPLLVVNGYTSQLISWQRGYVDQLVSQGLFVIQFDNRDVGLSSKFDGQRESPGAVLTASLQGEPIPPVPYTLSDMAADGIGLLDHLGIDRAHIVGNSMGGMIVQTMAIEHPERIASVTSVMSSPGDPRVGRPTPEARDAAVPAVFLPAPARRADPAPGDHPRRRRRARVPGADGRRRGPLAARDEHPSEAQQHKATYRPVHLESFRGRERARHGWP